MNDKKILRVGIYLRLSDEDRNKDNKDDDSESIRNQRYMLLEEINRRNNFVLVDEYCDEDLSGAGTYRPQFERLIRDCENGKLDVVMCKSQSRFSRDMEIIERYIHNKFIEWNIRFIGLVDNADTDNGGNKKSRQINGLVNEWYLEDVSNNIRSAFKAKMKRGEYISPFASYGYDISDRDNNKLVVDPIASLVVKDIFKMYLSGYGFLGIAKILNSKKIPSPSLYKYYKGIKLNVVSSKLREDIKWSSSSVKRILTNEVYLGHLIQGKRTTISYKNHKIKNKNKDEWIKVDKTHEAVIEEDVFMKVQHLIRERTKMIKNSDFVHIFSGKVFCLECGRYMRKKNSRKYQYLVCSSESCGYEGCSNNKSIRYDVLEKIILNKINEKIKMYFDKDLLKKNFELDSDYNNEDKIMILEKQKIEIWEKIKHINYYFKKLYEDKVDGNISLSQFNNLVKEYEGEECRYKDNLVELDRKITYYKKIMLDYKFLFDRYKYFNKLNRVIICEFVDKIYVGSILDGGRNIKIRWNF